MAHPGIFVLGEEATGTSSSQCSGKGMWQHKHNHSPKQGAGNGSVHTWKAAQGVCQVCWESSSAEEGKSEGSSGN